MGLTSQKFSNYISRALGVNGAELQEHFVPATNDDFDNLINLRKSLFSNGIPWDDEKYLKWRYCFDNQSQNHIWIFKNNGEIQGYIGVEELQIVIHGKIYLAYKTMDLFVKPELNGVGLGVWMSLVIREKYPILCAVGSNINSYPIASKIYHEMRLRKTFKLFLSSKAQFKRKFKLGFLAKILSIPFDLVLSRYWCNKVKIPDKYKIEILQSIPDAVDKFAFPKDKIFIFRNKSYLTWRFVNNPRRKYIVLGLYESGKLKAISISCIVYSSTNQQKEAFIADWVIDDIKPADLLQRYLFQKTVKQLKKLKAKLIHVSAFDGGSSRCLSQLGFFNREEDQTFFTYTDDSDLQEVLYNDDNWLLTEGDSDTEMF